MYTAILSIPMGDTQSDAQLPRQKKKTRERMEISSFVEPQKTFICKVLKFFIRKLTNLHTKVHIDLQKDGKSEGKRVVLCYINPKSI